MKKKFTLMMLLLLVYGSVSFGQATASLETFPATTASPGEPVSVPLMVTNFNSVGAITFRIDLDPAILSYVSLSPAVPPPYNTGFFGHVVGSSLWVTWTYPATEPCPTAFNGKLLDINFIYTGPGTSPLTFIPAFCEVGTCAMNPIPVTYTNGSVSQDLSEITKATIVGGPYTLGGPASAEIRYENFSENAGSITQKIHYDAAQLAYVNAVGTGALTGVIASAGSGVITLTWTKVGGDDINWTTSPLNKILLNFSYIGSATTHLEFYPGCIISNAGSPPANIKVSYYNGSITPASPPVAYATLGPVTEPVIQGADFNVPLHLIGFDALGPGSATAMTVYLTYDYPKLSYVTSTLNHPDILVDVAGSVISIVWTSTSVVPIDGEFLKLKFKYNGVGNAELKFAAGCSFSEIGGNTIPVGYTDAVVTPDPVTQGAYIGFPISAVGSTVAVPVYFKDMPLTIGAINLKIEYDAAKLTFVNVTDFPSSGGNFGVTGNIIDIAWTSMTPWTDINTANFCNLNFIVNGGGAAPVKFKSGCEVADLPDYHIIPTNWNDGGVNLAYKVSGYLTYDNVPNTPIAGVTVYLKQGANPYPDLTPAPVIVTSAVTDVNGYFEMWASDGTYWLDGDTDFPLWSTDWVNLGDVNNLRKYLAGVTPNSIGPITPTPPWTLRQKAANVYMNTDIDGGDLIVLRKRIAGYLPNPYYTAGDMTYENPVVTVSGAPVIQNFKGLSTGDVNGSYPF